MMRKPAARLVPSKHPHPPLPPALNSTPLWTQILLAGALSIIIITTTTTILHKLNDHHNITHQLLLLLLLPVPVPTIFFFSFLSTSFCFQILHPRTALPGRSSVFCGCLASLRFCLALLHSLTLFIISSPIPLQFVAPSLSLSPSRTTQVVWI